MNRSLIGHQDDVQIVSCNPSHRILVSYDKNNNFMIWKSDQDNWFHKVIDFEQKSPIAAIAWTFDGEKMCIIYKDISVIVASVDGEIIWKKPMKKLYITKVQWSPNVKTLLFGLKNGQIHLYDNKGDFIMQVQILCLYILRITVGSSLVGMDWYNGRYGRLYEECPNLAICYENGFLQIMYNTFDPKALLVDTKLKAKFCCWNHNGSALAVIGEHFSRGNLVHIYNPYGQHLRNLKIPGETITCCSWEEGSLRLAISSDNYVYIANIRPTYKWCYFKGVIVYSDCCIDTMGVCVKFWDIVEIQCFPKYVPFLVTLAAYGNYCVLITYSNTDANIPYGILVCNSLGVNIDERHTNTDIKWVAMNSSHVVAASQNNYLLWQFKNPASPVRIKTLVYQTFHIDYDPTGSTIPMRDFQLNPQPSLTPIYNSIDPITCITISNKYLFICKESGMVKQMTIPHVLVIKTYFFKEALYRMSLNCNSTGGQDVDRGRPVD